MSPLEWMTDPAGPIIGFIFEEAKMAKDKFTWTGETTWTRSYGTKAPTVLEKNKVYDANQFPADVLAEWVRTGHAKMTGNEKAGKED